MFFKNTYKRHQRKTNIITVFSSAYEVNKNFKIDKHILDLYFPFFRVGVIFGEYNKEDEKIQKLQEIGIVFLNILDTENIFSACGRILYFLKTQEYKMIEEMQSKKNNLEQNKDNQNDMQREESLQELENSKTKDIKTNSKLKE